MVITVRKLPRIKSVLFVKVGRRSFKHYFSVVVNASVRKKTLKALLFIKLLNLEATAADYLTSTVTVLLRSPPTRGLVMNL